MSKRFRPDFPELESLPNCGLCVPLSPKVPITERVQRLIENPILQRLKYVRQLALAHVIYPNAQHSRFEHSLGVFQRAGRYANALWGCADYDAFRKNVDERGIAALLVAALLHDCGHYPMAHYFEELIPTGFPSEALKYDEVVVRMLQGQLPGALSVKDLADLKETFGLWGVDVEDVVAVLTGYRDVTKAITPDAVTMLHSVLDGPLDADKLDCVQRDSLHTGNPAGRAVDEERLIGSLVIRSFYEGLGIHERGLYASQSLFNGRLHMFTSVYWHRLNRSLSRMFTEALFLFTQTKAQRFQQAFESDFFRLGDEAMLRYVGENIPERARKHLIDPLSISGERCNFYRCVVTISARPGSVDPSGLRRDATEPHGQICQMYDCYLQGNDVAPKWREFEHEARELTLRLAGGNPPSYSVLIDVPDTRFRFPVHSDEVLSSFMVYGHDQPVPIHLKDPFFGTNIDNWRMKARKVRIFVSPDVAKALTGKEEELSESIRELAGQIFEPAARPGGAHRTPQE